MTLKLFALFLAAALAALSTSGCQSTLKPAQAQTTAPFEPTALIIVDETRPLTIEELEAQRPAIVGYLVKRGYLESADALVDNPANASRIIRVILSPSGSFRITEFTLGNRSRQITTSSYTPGNSGRTDQSRYGYYDYRTARPQDPPKYSPRANNTSGNVDTNSVHSPANSAPNYSSPSEPSDR